MQRSVRATNFVYKLTTPASGDAQKEFNIVPEASYGFSIKACTPVCARAPASCQLGCSLNPLCCMQNPKKGNPAPGVGLDDKAE